MLLRPRRPFWRSCLRSFIFALVGSLGLSGAVDLLLVALHVDASSLQPPEVLASLGEFLGAAVVAPALETFLLAGGITVLSLLSKNKIFVAAISALLWGALHATAGALWFFGTVVGFFIFSCAYLAWLRVSFSKAYWAAAIPHALVNATAMALLFLFQSPNPSIERTASSQLRWLAAAAHVER
jgi:membrane protease YdiL (CAAX protease family)